MANNAQLRPAQEGKINKDVAHRLAIERLGAEAQAAATQAAAVQCVRLLPTHS